MKKVALVLFGFTGLLLVVSSTACGTSSNTATSESADAGGPAFKISAAAYDQHCTVSTDCVPVNDGELACGCGSFSCSANAAINRADMDRYDGDYQHLVQARLAACPAMDCGQQGLPACGGPAAFCKAGKCAPCAGLDCHLLEAGDACILQEESCKQGLLCCPKAGQSADAGATHGACTASVMSVNARPACP
jgi:hypothetical protein